MPGRRVAKGGMSFCQEFSIGVLVSCLFFSINTIFLLILLKFYTMHPIILTSQSFHVCPCLGGSCLLMEKNRVRLAYSLCREDEMPRTLSKCSEGESSDSLFFVDPDPHYCVGTKFPDPMTHQARDEQHCARVLIEL